MAAYRVYVLTADGHIAGPATVLECADEHEAVARPPN
jgi:hypothetical protein